VQQPQSPCPQLSRAPLRSKRYCNTSTRLSCGFTSVETGTPLSVKRIVRGVVKSASDKWGTLRLQQRAENLLRRQGQIGKMNTDRVGKRVSDGRREAIVVISPAPLAPKGPSFCCDSTCSLINSSGISRMVGI